MKRDGTLKKKQKETPISFYKTEANEIKELHFGHQENWNNICRKCKKVHTIKQQPSNATLQGQQVQGASLGEGIRLSSTISPPSSGKSQFDSLRI